MHCLAVRLVVDQRARRGLPEVLHVRIRPAGQQWLQQAVDAVLVHAFDLHQVVARRYPMNRWSRVCRGHRELADDSVVLCLARLEMSGVDRAHDSTLGPLLLE